MSSYTTSPNEPPPLAARVALVMVFMLTLFAGIDRLDWNHTVQYLVALPASEYVGL